ncbi:MAG: hypothetical protein INR71_01285 [Terriglobus roseus]|nr:hypothetical protein [Terriglobus roseus]
MAPTLVRLAAVADDDASALQVFLDGIPKHDNDVASSIQYLLDVAGALRAVDNAIRTEFGHPSHLPESLQLDIDLVLRSFSQTHEKLDKNLFQQTRQRAFGGRIPFKLLWDELDEQLTSEGSPLYSRLELYSTFLQNVLHAIER